MKAQSRSSEAGSALIVVLSVVATLTVTMAVAMEYTTNVRHNVQRSEALQTALAIGDGVLEHSFSYWREICRSNTDASLHNSSFQDIPLPTQAQFPTINNFTAQRAAVAQGQTQPPTVANFQVLAIDPEFRYVDSNSPLVPAIGQSPVTATYSYLGQADVSMPVLGGYVTAKVRRVFQKEQLSPWNWAISYVYPLEIPPGAPLNGPGWLRTNATRYTAHDVLTFVG